MKALMKNAFSDYLHVEILAVILAAVMVAAVTSYIAADSVYKASIIGGSVTPLLGAPGHLSGQVQEKAPSYYASQYLTMKEKIAGLFGALVWSNSSLLSSVYVVAVMIALFPLMYRTRSSFVPLLFRERASPAKTALIGLAASFIIFLPLAFSALFPIGVVSLKWLSGISQDSLILLSSILLSLLLAATLAVYSTYILWGRLDLSIVFTLLLAFLLSGKLGFEWRTVWVYLGTSAGLIVIMLYSFHRRWMSV
ncbi:hypothetical protein [Thermococcus sp. Bubb.Bath]|uniref:hypothetical protein n=1 Tax=Thermococcus sp. Bubb.Bath TaxID=1638242 RepID=UPI00143C7930|nr:hypothetical protein [Thermococcus sp. Bubb.Bath]NJF24477.1 hypothetical protein [Thermococcus sp. Bubb.Bath]